MNRYPYDLSHYVATCGRLGRLQTLSVVPVLAGDTLDVKMVGSLRLSSLRQALSLDAKVDVFTFFVPHRHVYGDEWVDMIKDGMGSTTVLPTTSGAIPNTGYIPVVGSVVPRFYTAGYAQIWNQYFRVPNVTVDEADWIPEDEFLPDPGLYYGALCARLPSQLTTGVLANTDSSLREVEPLGSGNIDLLDISQAQALYKSQVDRDWFERRYRDVLRGTFGSNGVVNIDADKRPDLLLHTEGWMSGMDVDGTDLSTLGKHKGKSYSDVEHFMPPKYFKEGGALWTMMLLRFPTIWNHEQHYLSKHFTDNSYEQFSGDPLLIGAREPQELNLWDLHAPIGTSDGPIGVHPFGQWHRCHPNNVHWKYNVIDGYPFIGPNDLGAMTVDKAVYESGTDFGMFQTTQLEHWNLICKLSIDAKRIVPPASGSVNAGAKFR